jgi:hypothetical protein
MKFIDYIEKTAGVDIFGLVSLTMFVLFFTIMLTWVIRADKKKIGEISRIPLDN